MNEAGDLRKELHDLIWSLQRQILTDAQMQRLESLLKGHLDLRREFIKYSSLISDLRIAANPKLMERTLQTALGVPAPQSQPMPRPNPTGGKASSALKLVHGLLRGGSETPIATALMWMVMALCTCGVVLTFAFVFLIVRGVHVHVDQHEVAKSTEHGAGNTEQNSPRLPLHSAAVEGSVEGSTVARFTRGFNCVWASRANAPKIGDDLAPGRTLKLKSGLAEIMFQGGVRTVLQGPATLQIETRMGAYLQQGKLAVKVEDPLVKGFVVNAPGMKYTDLGTEFGVFVAKDGAQELHVFRGRVQAEVAGSARDSELSTTNSALSAQPPLILSAHQAIRIAAPADPLRVGPSGKPFEQFVADEKQFCRVAVDPTHFPLFSTGVGLDRGAFDPHWEITQVSTDSSFRPRQAVVAVPMAGYVPDSRDQAQWISASKILVNMPGGCRWTLRTHFDLTGFDPATAQIEGRASVDDFLIEVRLNGKPVPLPAGARDRSGSQSGGWIPLKIEKGFDAGENVLEIVIENIVLHESIRSMINPMAFCVDWTGTARPTIKPSTGD